MNPRKSIEELQLQGDTGHVKRALRRKERDAEKRLAPETREYLDEIHRLIKLALHDCSRGTTIGEADTKPNPAYKLLGGLFKDRDRLLRENLPEVEKSNEDLLAELDSLTRN